MPRTPDQPTDPDAAGQPEEPVAEAADPVNADQPPGSPDGDEIHEAMVSESTDGSDGAEGDGDASPDR